jgi:hypothetical protein
LIRLLKRLLPLALLAGAVLFILTLIKRPGAKLGELVNDTINRKQPGTALDNITPGSWQDFFSFPYRLMNALGLMPDLPPIPGETPDPTKPIPDSELLPGDPGGTYYA